MDKSSDRCIFCRIIDGTAPSSEVHRDDLCVAFLDLSPVNTGHTLVCPLRHVESFTALEPRELQALMTVAQRVARTQKHMLSDCSAVNILLSDGEDAGQEVPHAHFHIIPRRKDDGFKWNRTAKDVSRDELDAIAMQLQAE
ncbi:MAG: HIT family protein [Woeseia sp.]